MVAFSNMALSGLSGIWSILPKLPVDLISGDVPDRICFRVHAPLKMQTADGNDMDLQTLFYLFVGLLPARDGRLFDLKIPQIARNRRDTGRFRSSRHTRHRPDPDLDHGLWKIVDSAAEEVSLWKSRIAFDVKLKLPHVSGVQRDNLGKSPAQILGKQWQDHERNWSDTGSLFHITQHKSMIQKSNDRLVSEDKSDIWMQKSDVCAIISAFLDLKFTPLGFLLGPAMNDWTGLLKLLFPPDELQKLLNLNNVVIHQLSLRKSKREQLLEVLVGAQIQRSKFGALRWSRGSIEAFSHLGSTLEDVCDMMSVEVRAVAVLFILCWDFRKYVIDGMADIENAVACIVRVDVPQNKVTIPALTASDNSSTDIPFDFNELLPKEMIKVAFDQGKSRNIDISYSQVLLACLWAELKIAVWKITLPGKDLLRSYTTLGRVVHISALSSPPEQNIWSIIQDGMSVLENAGPVLSMAMSEATDQLKEYESKMIKKTERDDGEEESASRSRTRRRSGFRNTSSHSSRSNLSSSLSSVSNGKQDGRVNSRRRSREAIFRLGSPNSTGSGDRDDWNKLGQDGERTNFMPGSWSRDSVVESIGSDTESWV